jgi:transcriptional regulator with PAS, ATPase and Fis domain
MPPEPTKPPSEQTLINLLAQGPETNWVIEDIIAKHKLPYEFTTLVCEIKDYQPVIAKQEWGAIIAQMTQGQLYLNKFITVALEKEKKRWMLAAKSPYEVLITGETGVGKDTISMSMVHDRKGPIKALNCAGFPAELIESELFGHVKGAFTDAKSDKKGLIKQADDGLLFLDEIGDMPFSMQSKLLRVIQNKTLRKVGGSEEENVTCKFVFATNKNLKKMLEEGLFRLDLFARISTLAFSIAPLRERKEDIIPIVKSLQNGEEFAEKFKEELSQSRFDLSLNVRSLQQHIIRWKVLGDVEMI